MLRRVALSLLKQRPSEASIACERAAAAADERQRAQVTQQRMM
jgi:hypothetical protein